VATNTAAPQSNVISPERFLSLYRDIKDTKRHKEEAAAAHKAAKDRAKSEGVDLNSLKIVEHLTTLDDAEAELRMRETLRYAAWLGLEVGTQADMFGEGDGPRLTDKITGQHQEWKAEQDGYTAGKDGEPADNCPHPGTSPLRERWMTGWRDGHAHACSLKPQAPESA
jgi:ribosome modulation factor